MADTSLLPVVVGGLLAMGGGAVTGGITLVVNAIQARQDKERRRTAKFEELVTVVYEFEAWLDDREDNLAFGKDLKAGVSPLAKLEGISAVYFPVFLESIAALSKAAKDYQAWMGERGARRGSGIPPSEWNAGFDEVYKPYLHRRNELLEELKKYAIANFR
jgi:hypothetical protein